MWGPIREADKRFLLILSKTKSKNKWKWIRCHVQLFATPWTVAFQAPPPMGFSGKNTGVGCHFLLQEIFQTQGLNPGLSHCRQTFYHLSHQGNQRFTKINTFIKLFKIYLRKKKNNIRINKRDEKRTPIEEKKVNRWITQEKLSC